MISTLTEHANKVAKERFQDPSLQHAMAHGYAVGYQDAINNLCNLMNQDIDSIRKMLVDVSIPQNQ